jgi:hypothetical protein
VDTWKGDAHSGNYDNEVYETVTAVCKQLYANEPILIRKTFDEAAACFQDQSIDLLHIDGYHTLEAVSHDYETWLPKVSPEGVILFHDTASRFGDFGVYRLWEQLKMQHPSFEFEHSGGLGVLFPNGYDSRIQEIISIKEHLPTMYSYKATHQ